MSSGVEFALLPVHLNDDGSPDVVLGRGPVFFAQSLGGPVPSAPEFLQSVHLGSEILEIDLLGGANAKRFVVRTAAALHIVTVTPSGGGYTVTQMPLANGVFGDGTRDGVIVADTDADGIPDIVTIRPSNGTVLRFPGITTGVVGSTPVVSPGGPGQLVGLTLGDLDGDGDQDFVGFSSPGGAYPLENTGGGTFAPFVQPAPTFGGDAYGGAAADFTGDGDVDVFVIGPTSSAHLWTGDGLGGFLSPPIAFVTNSGTGSVAAADYNGDGITDVAVANFDTDTVGMYFGDGAGLVGPLTQRAGDGPVRVIPFDIEDDGDTDLIVTHKGFIIPVGPLLFENSGLDGVSYPESIIDRPVFTPRAMAVGDLDGDGLRDILVTTLGSGMHFIHNEGQGVLSAPTDLELPVSYPELRAVEAGDGDPRNLIAYRNTSPSRIGWLRFDPDTQSLNFGQFLSLPTLPLDLWSDDMNGDGLEDILVSHANGAPAVSLFLQTVTPSFLPRIAIDGPANAHTLLTGDVDGANGSDLILVDSGAVHFAPRTGPAAFGPWTTRTIPDMPSIVAAAVGEVDGKPGLDGVFVGSGPKVAGNRLLILSNIAGPYAPTILSLPAAPLAVATLDIDGDGDADVVVTLDRPAVMNALAVLTSDNGVFDPDAITLHLTGSLPETLILADLHEPVQHRGAPARSLPEAIVLSNGAPSQGVAGVAININMTEVRSAPAAPCPGDTNGDQAVNFADLNAVLSAFGDVGAPGTLPADLNGDGTVNFSDLNAVLSAFGSSCG